MTGEDFVIGAAVVVMGLLLLGLACIFGIMFLDITGLMPKRMRDWLDRTFPGD